MCQACQHEVEAEVSYMQEYPTLFFPVARAVNYIWQPLCLSQWAPHNSFNINTHIHSWPPYPALTSQQQ